MITVTICVILRFPGFRRKSCDPPGILLIMQANGLVVFDMDGTLYRTDLVTVDAVKLAGAELDEPVLPDGEIRAGVGRPMEDFCRYQFPEANEKKLVELIAAVRRNERELIPKRGTSFDRIPELLENLKANGLKLTVCSNAGSEYLGVVLGQLGIEQYFCDSEGHKQGRMKAGALSDLLARHPGSAAVLVGDTVFDEEAACRNAIPFIAAAYGYGSAGLAHCDYIAHSPDDILGHVNRWRVFTILEQRAAAMKGDTPLIIGVSGPDCAGKTHFARGLAAHLRARGMDAPVIHLDDFHNPRSVRHRGEDEIEAYIDNAFNLDLLVAELLDPLSRHGRVDASLTLLDLQSDGFTNEKHWAIGEGSIVILEGALLYRPPVDSYIDLRVQLDVSFDKVLQRALVRDREIFGDTVLQRYREKYIPVQKRYMAEFKPLERADVVVDNNDWDRPVAKFR